MRGRERGRIEEVGWEGKTSCPLETKETSELQQRSEKGDDQYGRDVEIGVLKLF